ncbi:MAG: cellulase family glycosylhydrolase [Fibrobacter sp.]|nr:cellulase family glycosylhydrolase [Fibrobacter sp.]
MKKLLSTLLLSCAVSFAAGVYDGAKPLRVGPVSAYGALGTSGSKVVSISSGKQVTLRGMSLFWSDATGSPYYNSEVISWAAEKLGIDVFRFAMAIDCYKESDCSNNSDEKVAASYKSNPSGLEAKLDNMVKVAIENDIYIIVDWHSHRARSEQALATDFFGRMAAKYANVPNIIWEVFNEPVNDGMGEIASYANTVISAIRTNGSPNLALVGTPFYSQMGSCGGVNQTNVGYVFHFYAATHTLGAFKNAIEGCLSNNAVFVTEWGTTEASGAGSISEGSSKEWLDYLDGKGISNCNWSLRHETVGNKPEASAMFKGSTVLNSKAALNEASYTTSGTIVKNYLTSKSRAGTWADSITAGKHTGACAFAHASASEMETSIEGKASASCTYTSSDESVATIEAGSIKIHGAGVAIMTGNDGSQTVVNITAMPNQTFTQPNVTCRLSGSGCQNFSGDSKMQQKMNETVTIEGSPITYTSDNPDVVSVEKMTCTSANCYSYKNQQVWIASFKSVGVAHIRATAAAVPGYRALDTTVTFTYAKNVNSLNTKYFKNQTVALGSTTQVFTVEAHKVPVTYTITPEGYATQDGEMLVAGNVDATITIHAVAPEAETYEAIDETIMINIGAGNLSMIEGITPKTMANVSMNARMNGNKLVMTAKHSGFVTVQVVDMAGRTVKNVVKYVSAGSNVMDLGEVAHGNYFVNVKQSSMVKTIPWSNK